MNLQRVHLDKIKKGLDFRVAILLLSFVILFSLPASSYAFFHINHPTPTPEVTATPTPTPTPEPSLIATGIARVTSALSRVRNVLGGVAFFSHEQRIQEELGARKEALESIIDFLLSEIEQAQNRISHMSGISTVERKRLEASLADNHQWLNGMLTSVKGSESSYYLKIIAQDLQQFRNQRHTILIRTINERALAQRQQSLLQLAERRSENIYGDLTQLAEEGYAVEDLWNLYESAQAHLENAQSSMEEAEALLSIISPPYEEARYRNVLDEIHEHLVAANSQTLEAYRIYVEMSDLVHSL